jgi:hypothetical protein
VPDRVGGGVRGGDERPRLRARAVGIAARLQRSAHAALPRPPLRRAIRTRRECLPQARGPQPHRRPQDQQLPGPGAAGTPHGKAPYRGRNGCRPARRRHRYRGGAVRDGVYNIHGRSRHGAPAPQPAAHAAAGGAGRPRGLGEPHTQGRHQRDHPRLGDQRAHHPLHHRIYGGAASVSHGRARLPVGDRPRDARADPGGRTPPARRRGRLRRGRFQRPGHVHGVSGGQGHPAFRRCSKAARACSTAPTAI